MSPDGIFVTDAQGVGLYTNRRWQETVGLSLEASLSTDWRLAIHPDDRDVQVAGWSGGALDAREYEAEFRIQHPSGRVRWVRSRSRPLYHPNGDLRGHVGTVQDVTDRKRMEQRMAVQYVAGRAMSEAREQEAGLAVIVQQVGVALAAETGGLWAVHAETGLVQCRYFWSASPTRSAPFEARSRSLALHIGEGIPGRVFSTDNPAWLEE
ncbi:MAG: PAS domain S-box protein, partial [Nitrospira sp.]